MQPVAESPIDPSSLMLLAVVVLVVTMVIISTRRRSADRGRSPRAYAREQLARLREQDEVRSDLKELMMHLEELSRDISAQCETRFAKLERVIADADARIAELKRLGFGQGTAASGNSAGQSAPPSGDERSREESQESGQASSEPPGTEDALQREILELAEAGKPPVEIARQLGRDIGEVELIINLNRRDQDS